MRTSQANRLARWAAFAAAAVTLVSAIAYGWKQWEARQAAKEAPPLAPEPVRQRSDTFTYSKVEGQRTLFTIRASQATEFKEGGKSLLQDVWITIYGRAGKRFDNIHTRECDYQPATGRIVCSGDVQIDLESAVEAGAQPGQRAIQIRTSNVSFDRETGEARTERPVEFKFAEGAGRGVGLQYVTREGIARLLQHVEVTLNASASAQGGAASDSAPTRLNGNSLEYTRDTRLMRLLGPVAAVQGARELRAGSLDVQFSAAMHAERLVARERPSMRELASGGETTLAAEEISVALHRDNCAESIVASGRVAFSAKDPAGEDRLSAQRVELDLAQHGTQPRQMRASGGVQAASQRASGAARRLDTESLQLDFLGSGGAGRRVSAAQTLAPATMELQQGEEQSRVRAARLAVQFDARGEARNATGSGGVEVERRIGQRPAQQTASREVAVQFDARGEWTELQQSGDVRFREGARSGQAQQARAVRSSETLTLSGGATVADAVSRTAAASIEVNQRTGEVVARGGVRTSYTVAAQRPGATFVPVFSTQPAHIAAEELRAQAEQGIALYSGKARLWQGDSVIEANAIELRRGAGDERQLLARENVRAMFPQAAATPGVPPGNAVGEAVAASVSAGTVWRVRAGQLRYNSAEQKIHLDDKVSAESSVGLIQSQRLEMFLEGGSSKPGAISRAEATGGVVIRQGHRRATAERADYFADEGKFVLSGGKPTLYDAELGTTTGRQLTFFLADDKILVDSEEGLRTVTRHRVGK